MTIKELMIGDWVNKISPSGIVIPIKITLQELVDMENPIELGKYVWKPIPLTEDMLKANGWKCSALYWFHKKVSFELFPNKGDGHPFINTRGEVCYDFKHVHQLQHALRLCGFTDLADNFKVE